MWWSSLSMHLCILCVLRRTGSKSSWSATPADLNKERKFKKRNQSTTQSCSLQVPAPTWRPIDFPSMTNFRLVSHINGRTKDARTTAKFTFTHLINQSQNVNKQTNKHRSELSLKLQIYPTFLVADRLVKLWSLLSSLSFLIIWRWWWARIPRVQKECGSLQITFESEIERDTADIIQKKHPPSSPLLSLPRHESDQADLSFY
jgi:hypothetical protein